MPKQLIEPKNKSQGVQLSSVDTLKISELFTGTLQGEGIYTGYPATFLRLKGCAVNCGWCDSQKIWTLGQRYTFAQITDRLFDSGVVEKFREGQHLVITGGSPLLQQEELVRFLEYFEQCFHFLPFIEVENEATIHPLAKFAEFVNCWNNSPKLENSGVDINRRYYPDVLAQMSKFPNSWFKFVIQNENEWWEIKQDFLDKKLIRKDQIILMPEGANQEDLNKNKLKVAELAMKMNVKFCGRLQIDLYNTKTGV